MTDTLTTDQQPVKSLTDAELAEVHAREQAATAGPWEWDHEQGRLVKSEDRYTILYPRSHNPGFVQIDGPYSNLEFIAHARADIPRLLATIAELKTILADCQQDSMAYLAGVRDGRGRAVEDAKAFCPPDCLLEGCREMFPDHYRDDRYCDRCDRETLHDCKDSGHERDSSQDYRKCLVCGLERWGMN